MIGRRWQSGRGPAEIVGRHPNGAWLVRYGDSRSLVLEYPAGLERTIQVDENWAGAAVRAEQRALAESATKREADAEFAATLRGFTDGMSARARGRAEKILRTSVGYRDGPLSSRAALIARLTGAGACVSTDRYDGRRVFEIPGGVYLDEKELTKTGMDFAEHVAGRCSARREN